MKARALIGLLALVVLTLLVWELRWVLLVLFGAVVLAVALDVPVTWLRRLTRLNRPSGLVVVLTLIVLGGWQLGQLLLPELVVLPLYSTALMGQLSRTVTPLRTCHQAHTLFM